MQLLRSHCVHHNNVDNNTDGLIIKLRRGKHWFFVFYKEPIKKNLSARDIVYYSLNISFVVGIIDTKEMAYGICLFDILSRFGFIVLSLSGVLTVNGSIIIAILVTFLVYEILLFIGREDDRNIRIILEKFLKKSS